MFIIRWQTTVFKTVFLCMGPSQQTAGSTSKLTGTEPPRKKQKNASKTPTRLRPDTLIYKQMLSQFKWQTRIHMSCAPNHKPPLKGSVL